MVYQIHGSALFCNIYTLCLAFKYIQKLQAAEKVTYIAAAFTVPGGNKQDTGLPIFLHNNVYTTFLIAEKIKIQDCPFMPRYASINDL